MRTPLRRLVAIVAAAVAAMALAATAAGPAQAAVSWHSNKGIVYPSWTYPGAFTTALTGGDWTIGGVTVSCFNSWAVGQLSGTATAFGVAGPAAGAFAAAAVTPKFASCMPTTVACQADKIVPVAASTMSAGPTTAAYNAGTQTLYSGAASKKTTGTLLAVDCEFVSMGVTCVTLTGTIPFTYANPSSVGGVLWPPAIVADTALDATLTLRSTNQTWAAAGPGCPVLPNPGSAPVRLKKPGGGDLKLSLSGGTDQPVIWYGDL
ncbi:MAG: hypothetical protein ABW167_22715 [Baekduia sp.]